MVHKISLPVFFVLSALLAACAPEAAQPAPTETQPVETLVPESVPPTEVVPATETPSVSTLWVGYRGEHKLLVVARDRAGNESEAEIGFVVE